VILVLSLVVVLARYVDNAAMAQSGRSDAVPHELSDEARKAADEQQLGALLNSFPVQEQLFLIPKYKNTGHWLHQFAEGILATSSGSVLPAMRFDEISHVFQAYRHHYASIGYQGSEYRFTIAAADTRSFTLRGEFWDPESSMLLRSSKGDPGLVTYCQSLAVEVSRARLDRAWQDLQEGKALTFGKIVFTAEGVQSGTDVVSWREVAPLLIHRGGVWIVRAKNRVEVAYSPIGSVPNLPLLHVLTQRLREDSRSADLGRPDMALSSERQGKQRR
jgi:hypothetical protein